MVRNANYFEAVSKETDLEFLRGYRIGLEFALRTAKGIEANSPKTIEVCGE